MRRSNRTAEAGGPYHALNRGNGRATLFQKPEDYDAFEHIVAVGLREYADPQKSPDTVFDFQRLRFPRELLTRRVCPTKSVDLRTVPDLPITPPSSGAPWDFELRFRAQLPSGRSAKLADMWLMARNSSHTLPETRAKTAQKRGRVRTATACKMILTTTKARSVRMMHHGGIEINSVSCGSSTTATSDAHGSSKYE